MRELVQIKKLLCNMFPPLGDATTPPASFCLAWLHLGFHLHQEQSLWHLCVSPGVKSAGGTSLFLSLCSWNLASPGAACAMAKFPVAAPEANCAREECAGSANQSRECEETTEGERERIVCPESIFSARFIFVPCCLTTSPDYSVCRHKLEQEQHHV